jgi:lipopolysaccharide biosynthesis glycosyltransferase
MSQQSARPCEPIAIVTSCDENYVRGAAAAIRSAIDSLPRGRRVQVYMLDGGISESSKARLLRSWQAPHVEVRWLKPDLDAIRDLPISHWISLATYLRLFSAEMLPADVNKAIYLDADAIVARNLEELWSLPLEGKYCAAVQEVFSPVLDPAEVYSHPLYSMTVPNMDPRPIPNYRELGLAADAPYFNAGILLMNVKRWREDGIARRALECLRDNAGHVRFWDQYALNVVFSGQWKIIDPRWNQNTYVFQLPSWELSHYTEQELDELKRNPWIVHFNFLPKPWDLKCDHPFRDLFFKHLDRTSWRRWRPRPPRIGLRKRAELLYLDYRAWRRTRISPALRKWRQRLIASWRRAA